MSNDPIEKWLHAMNFEIFRLTSTLSPLSIEEIESRIKDLESMPVTKGTRNSFKENIDQLECLKHDLQSLRELGFCYQRIHQVREQIREKGTFDFKELENLHARFDTAVEKKMIEQGERQRQHLASLKQLWPKADYARKREMMGTFATYGRWRLKIRTSNYLLAIPRRIVKSLLRGYKRSNGL